jgi:hypothetical protein
MWNLNQDARAIAGFRIATAGATMGEVDKYLQSLQYDIVGLLAFNINHEADTAGVVFVPGIVKSLLDWESIVHLYTAFQSAGFGMSHQYTKNNSIAQIAFALTMY